MSMANASVIEVFLVVANDPWKATTESWVALGIIRRAKYQHVLFHRFGVKINGCQRFQGLFQTYPTSYGSVYSDLVGKLDWVIMCLPDMAVPR